MQPSGGEPSGASSVDAVVRVGGMVGDRLGFVSLGGGGFGGDPEVVGSSALGRGDRPMMLICEGLYMIISYLMV